MIRDLEILAPAMKGTAIITVITFSIAIGVGFLLFVLRRSPIPVIPTAVTVSGVILRGLPPLTWIFIAFFGLTSIGLRLTPWQAGIGALAAVGSAYVAEFFRSGFEAVGRGQRDAAYSLGLSPARAMLFVTLPQALRASVPPISNYGIGLLKDTSLVSVVGVSELTYTATVRTQETFSGPRVYVAAALLYLVMSYPLSIAGRRLERRLAEGYRAHA